ncbi:unnamed protein product [Bursaphelenchus okinawaensis]|uniref:Phospholipid/glycerol acyltransferase domain-containing protein n=1 Tax=Bursaphelenchus okinawaensis TaxID=465554 RepID=A0A811L8Q1_9BILA|nr:unnamed protein product [Bursaphelenchus okinawaensis]CAG9119916.1 unnamed protein product [Bursaphelenchus okinawaensis]
MNNNIIKYDIIHDTNRFNLLDISYVGDIHVVGVGSVSLNKRITWFRDVRYVWNHSIPYKYPSVQDKVMNSARVRRTIEEVAAEEQTNVSAITKRAWGFFYGIRAAYSKVWTRFLGYLMFKVFRRLMKVLYVCPEQMNRLIEADKSGVSLLYLPLHRSHLDYQIITWVLWHWGIRFPHVAAGDNLNLYGFGWMLRFTGAFFIRRRIDQNDESTQDKLYRNVLKTYLIELLKSGLSVEFFLEGTRSRMGKSLLPKNGLISNVLEAIDTGEVKDVYLVPTSITYDSAVEGVFYNELMGVRKKKENFFRVIKGVWESFSRKTPCGVVCIDFGEPRLLSEELRRVTKWLSAVELPELDYAMNRKSYRELMPWSDTSLTHRNKVRAVGYNIVYLAQRQQPILLSSLMAALFLSKYRTRKVTTNELISDIETLSAEIRTLGFEVLGWTPDIKDNNHFVREMNKYLDHCFIIDSNYIQLIDCHKTYITLSYHKNALLPVYCLISVAALLKPVVTENGDSGVLIKRMSAICTTLRYEMLICSPCGAMEEHMEMAINFWESGKNSFEREFYYKMITPFLTTLRYVSLNIKSHQHEYKNVTDNDYIRTLAQQMANDPKLELLESANSESIYNSLKALRAWGALNENGIEILSEYLITQTIRKLNFLLF